MCDVLTRNHWKFAFSLIFLQKKKANPGQNICIHNGAEQELPEQEFMWTEITFTQERMEAQWFR